MKSSTSSSGENLLLIWFSWLVRRVLSSTFGGGVSDNRWTNGKRNPFVYSLTTMKNDFHDRGFFTQLHKLRSLRRSFLHFYFISAVHIWFISYIINSHLFDGNVWTHNWPAPNVSGFIAQSVEHRTGIASSRVQTPLKSWIFFQASLRNCINCVHWDDHFFIFKVITVCHCFWCFCVLF